MKTLLKKGKPTTRKLKEQDISLKDTLLSEFHPGFLVARGQGSTKPYKMEHLSRLVCAAR